MTEKEKDRILELYRPPILLTQVEISKIYNVSPERIRQIIRKLISEEEHKKIKEERSIFKAVMARSKNVKEMNQAIINKMRGYETTRQSILRKSREQ